MNKIEIGIRKALRIKCGKCTEWEYVYGPKTHEQDTCNAAVGEECYTFMQGQVYDMYYKKCKVCGQEVIITQKDYLKNKV